MYTGIVEQVGTVEEVAENSTGRRIVISGGPLIGDLSVGDSVAVNGVCLTAVAVSPGRFEVDVVQESLCRSNLGALEAASPVDLEWPLPVNGRFDGHIVQGHVDGVGTVAAISAEGDARRVRVTVPGVLARYLVEKGSITVDGVSLTLTAVSPVGSDPAWFEVVLIPHTLDVTVLGLRKVGDAVNLEADVLAKYVERLMEASR